MAKKKANQKTQLELKFEIQDLEYHLQKMQEQYVVHREELHRLGQEIPEEKEKITEKMHELMDGIE